MLEAVKLAMRPAIKTNAYDDEIRDLIAAAKADLQRVGIVGDDTDPLIRQAIKTYCRLHFGSPPDAEKLERSYAMQVGSLMGSGKYRNWGDSDGT